MCIVQPGFVQMAESFEELDRLKAEADASDPMKPGMWRVDDRMGRFTEDWVDVMNRAAAKYGSPANADEPLRFARARKIAQEGSK